MVKLKAQQGLLVKRVVYNDIGRVKLIAKRFHGGFQPVQRCSVHPDIIVRKLPDTVNRVKRVDDYPLQRHIPDFLIFQRTVNRGSLFIKKDGFADALKHCLRPPLPILIVPDKVRAEQSGSNRGTDSMVPRKLPQFFSVNRLRHSQGLPVDGGFYDCNKKLGFCHSVLSRCQVPSKPKEVLVTTLLIR